MFNSKYSKVLTGLLIAVIIAIVGTVAYFIYDIYVVKSKNNDLKDAADQFTSSIQKKETDTEDGDAANPLDTIGQLERSQVATEKQYLEGYEIMGTISIPKTGIEYPILEKVTTKSLDTSVAILYGVGLNQPGNTTIAGHNYRNGAFFSDNSKLAKGDIINITDQTGQMVSYSIYDIFQTTPSDASYMTRDTEGAREISLTTCNDDSSLRLIILAKEKES